MKKLLRLLVAGVLLLPVGGIAQDAKERLVQTVFPFLLIAADARSAAMADAGAATSPDSYSAAYNSAKLAYVDAPYGVALSYSPWLRSFVSGMNLSQMNAYYRLSDKYVLGASFKYFNMGNVELTNDNEALSGSFTPNELAFDMSLAKKFSDHFSLGASIRYTGANEPQQADFSNLKAAKSLALDMGAYFKNDATIFGQPSVMSYGISISNIGTKVAYTETGNKYFMPANLKLGANSRINMDKGVLNFALDLNKLLVPSSIEDAGLSVPGAIFRSFSDARGGFSEELKEVSWSLGAEYIYNDQLAVRMGYLYENPIKGNRNYLSLGAGYKYLSMLSFDVAYIAASQEKSPLANTLRFSVSYNFGKKAHASERN